MTTNSGLIAPVSVLYVPAHKPRAIEKARALAADMIVLDLEDAVPGEDKDAARIAVAEALDAGFGNKRVAVRINGGDRGDADMEALENAKIDFIVIPKVGSCDDIPASVDRPVLAMVETPAGVLAAARIASDPRVAGLIAGLNDLAFELQLPIAVDRSALSLSLQTIVLAARASGIWCFDGVCNAIDDAERFEREARHGWGLGFDGKTLIHPSQVDSCNHIWTPDAETVSQAQALVAAAKGGAERFEGRMIEDMHVQAAKRIVSRAALR